MSFRSAKISDIYILRWEMPVEQDIQLLFSHIKTFALELGRPPFYFAIVPADSETPSPAVRKALMGSMAPASALCTSVHLIMEGRGVRFTAQRSAAAAMFLLAGTRKIFTHDTFDAALAQTRHPASEHKAIAAQAQAQGLVSKPKEGGSSERTP